MHMAAHLLDMVMAHHNRERAIDNLEKDDTVFAVGLYKQSELKLVTETTTATRVDLTWSHSKYIMATVVEKQRHTGNARNISSTSKSPDISLISTCERLTRHPTQS